MEPFGQYITEQSERDLGFPSSFFSRSPLRSYYFLAGAVALVTDLAMVGLVLHRYWSQMSTTAILNLGFATVGILLLWYRVYLTCQRLHGVYSKAKSSPTFAGSVLDFTLRNAAAMTWACLYFSFFIVAWLLVLAASAFRSH
jgi:hypothetical protein